jgi:hypothetical protein
MHKGVDLLLDKPLRNRGQAVEFINRRGVPMTPSHLAKLRVTGNGPAFRKFGRVVRYAEGDLLQWIEDRLTPLVRSTSELPGHRRRTTRPVRRAALPEIMVASND